MVKNQNGFTLIETTISLMIVSMAIITSMFYFLQGGELALQTNEQASSMQSLINLEEQIRRDYETNKVLSTLISNDNRSLTMHLSDRDIIYKQQDNNLYGSINKKIFISLSNTTFDVVSRNPIKVRVSNGKFIREFSLN